MMKDLTTGKPNTVLWKFSIPMFVSVIFQQLYTIADSVIAGRYAGDNALAEVGASYPITMIFMAIAFGSNIGCSVVISNLFGQKEWKRMKTAIYTSLVASFALSVILTVFGVLLSGVFIDLLKTPGDIRSGAITYLQIYIGGFVFLFLYNVETGIFTSMGDSQTPLYLLIGSSVGNIVLDLLFVIQFHWGVPGVAWATFIAQGIACIVAFTILMGRLQKVKTDEKPKLFSMPMLKRISGIAIPSILQQSFVSVGNLFIQVLVNKSGADVISGYSAAIKLNTFAITSFSTLGNGISSFTAQNIGAEKYIRVRKGMRAGLKMVLLIAAMFFGCFFFLSEPLIRLFMNSESVTNEAVQTGVAFLHIVTPFYFVASVKLLADGVLRGASAMKDFMITTFTDLILRVILAYIFYPIWQATGIWLSWPIGWSIAAVLSITFYLIQMKRLEKA